MVRQGIVSSADKVITRNYSLLHPDTIQQHNIKIGDGIFLLTKKELEELNIPKAECKLIKYFYQNVDIGSYVPEKPSWSEDKFLIYTTKDIRIEDYQVIYKHLVKFKAILSSKRETKQGKIPWFSLHWPRGQELFEDVKIVSPHYRFKRPFIYSEGDFYTSDENYVIKKKPKVLENGKYILGILNSDLLDVWYINRLTLKGSGYEFLGEKLQQIPIRRIDFTNPKEVKIHDKLVSLVDNIIEFKKRLATFNQFFPKTRLTRLTENAPLPDIDIEAIVKSLTSSSLRTFRTHSEIKYEPKAVESFYLKGVRKGDAKTIILTSKSKQQITLTAPNKVLEYLDEILPVYAGKEWQEIINHIFIPSDLTLLEGKKKGILAEVTSLRGKIAKIQQNIDKIVFGLYGITKKEKVEICRNSV